MTDYGQLRDGLWDIQHEFEHAHSWAIPLYHDLIWSPGFEGWDQAEYQDFVFANKLKEEYTGEEWELWPGCIACSRYYGSRALFETRLRQFQHLAARAYRTLCAMSQLYLPQYQLVAPASVNFSVMSEAVPNDPDGSAVHFGWLELIHDAGLYHPSPSLQSDNGWWKYQGAGELDAALEAKHPSYQSVSADLFDASAEYIQMILEPETVGFLQPKSYQVQIAAGGTSATHTVTHRPTICIPDEADIPLWDASSGELWFRDQLIKTLKRTAFNQRKILDAFEDQGWPSRITNPFREPMIANYLMDQTLKSTITDLQRERKVEGVLSFGQERDGEYATWYAG